MTNSSIQIRHSNDRGKADFGWLDSRHTFSFGHYYDPTHMHYRSLRVINEDKVAPSRGFDAHPHDNMEILSYVLSGALEHKDSMGTGSVIKPGDIQRMSAGSGVTHSEFNHSDAEEVHFLQIWILPKEKNIEPSYEQKFFSDEDKLGTFCLVGSPDGRDGSITIHQDVNLYAIRLDAGQTATLPISPTRHVWIQVTRGGFTLQNQDLQQGDGASFTGGDAVELSGTDDGSEALVFDLA